MRNLIKDNKHQRKVRTRVKIFKTSTRPRLSVYRSNKHINAQIIDDAAGETLVAVSDNNVVQGKVKVVVSGIEIARRVGEELAKKAKTKRISKVVFDKGAYKYHGRIKALADGARKGGLIF